MYFHSKKYLINNITLMKEKELYAYPEIRVIEIEPEGVICDSTDTTVSNPFGGLTEDEW